MDKIVRGAKKFSGSLQDYVVNVMATLDANNDGFVDVQEFAKGLEKMNIFTTTHEQHTLLRKFDYNGDGKVSMEEFYNTLAALF
jgi:Ca2+-binding EF-hand superfamily protein